METIDSEVLSALIDAKMEQLPWKKLPERYKELTGDTANWRELKRYVLKEMGTAMLLPARISSQSRDQVQQTFNSVKTGTLAVPELMGTYLEWSGLRERNIRSFAVSEVDRDNLALRNQLPKPLSPMEITRMDQLPKQVVSFLLTEVTAMTQAQPFNALVQTAAWGASNSKDEVTFAQVVAKMLKEVGVQSAKMLDDVNERHKQEGIGHYRPSIEDRDDED